MAMDIGSLAAELVPSPHATIEKHSLFNQLAITGTSQLLFFLLPLNYSRSNHSHPLASITARSYIQLCVYPSIKLSYLIKCLSLA
jgi:hypothetical protein